VTRQARPEDLGPLLALAEAEYQEGAGGVGVRPVLARAVPLGRVLVAESDGVLAGYAAVEEPLAGHVRVSSVAVRGDLRRSGVAGLLLDEVLDGVRGPENSGTAVSAVIGVRDLEAAGLLLSRGFIATRIIWDTGSGGAQLHFQHKIRVEYVDPDARHLIPASAVKQLADSLAPGDFAVTALAELSGEPVFEISRFERDDPATLQSGEAAAGIAFSGSMLAVITFLLGFAFASSRFPDDVRLLLICATFVTMMSLIVYASASGELARIRSNAFGKIMKWGNVFSEYGGVLPFVISLPITYAAVTTSSWSAVATGAGLSVALVAYERSDYSIASRFRWTLVTVFLAGLTCASPLVGAVLVVAGVRSWPWTAVLLAALAGRTWVYLFRRGLEAGSERRRGPWQIRN
jgi:N-acetylglutamate synthase-like GNAT family acetyltransferase